MMKGFCMKIMAALPFRSAWIAAAVAMPLLLSCEISGGSGPNGTYGFPYADFEVEGTVVDDLGQPLSGVTVYFIDQYWGMTYTDVQPDGRFSLYGTFTPSSSMVVTAVDVDMDDGLNWGHYYDARYTVPLTFVEGSDNLADEWFSGLYICEEPILIQMFREW